MASRLLFFHMPLVLALYFSNTSAAQLEAGAAPPLIHIISQVGGKNSAHIKVRIKAGEKFKGSADLSLGQDYRIKADLSNVYYASALYGLKFASFHAYEPARDKGQAAVYWRADSWGFRISYNNTNWSKVAPWESE